MKEKLLTIILALAMITSTFIIIPSEIKIENVKGDATPPPFELDTQYIFNIAYNLSDIIHRDDVYGPDDFKKGRAFGTNGEHYAAEYLVREMSNLSLNPIKDRIQNTEVEEFEKYSIIKAKKLDITDRLDITSMSLIINESDSVYADLAESEFFISPRWDKYYIGSDTYHPQLTHNYNYDDVKIREDIYHKYFDRPFLKNIDEILVEIANGNISDIEEFVNFTILLYENEYNFTFDDLDINNSATWPSFFDGDFSLFQNPYLFIYNPG